MYRPTAYLLARERVDVPRGAARLSGLLLLVGLTALPIAIIGLHVMAPSFLAI